MERACPTKFEYIKIYIFANISHSGFSSESETKRKENTQTYGAIIKVDICVFKFTHSRRTINQKEQQQQQAHETNELK